MNHGNNKTFIGNVFSLQLINSISNRILMILNKSIGIQLLRRIIENRALFC